MSNQQVENKSNESTKDVSNANVVTNASSSQVSTLRPPVYQLKTADEKAEKSDVPQKDYAGSPPPENNTSKFKDVSVHTNSSKATELNAKAFTQGNNIHFAPGMFNENTTQGKQLISHELSHVIQQKTSQVKPTTSINGNPVNDDASLEKQADIEGRMMKHRLPVQRKSDNNNQGTVQRMIHDNHAEESNSSYFKGQSSNTIQCCGGGSGSGSGGGSGGGTTFSPPTGKKTTKLKGSYGAITVGHGLVKLPTSTATGEYEIQIDMVPNEDTAASKRIGFIQTVRRSPGPGKAWSTKATDPGMSQERADRATKEGWRVDRGDAKRDKSPFYGTQKDNAGNLNSLSNSRFGSFGGAGTMLWDRPAVQDPTALEFVATAMDPDQGIAYDAVHWGFSYDSSSSHYKEITPSIIPGNSKLLKSRNEAFDAWDNSDGKNKNIDKVTPFAPNIGNKVTALNTKYGAFKATHGLLKAPTSGTDGSYSFNLEMTPTKETGKSRIGFVQTVRRSDGRGKKWATKATDSGMSKEREARATPDGWRVDRADAKRDKTSFYGMQKQKNGKIKDLGYAKIGSFGKQNPYISDTPAVVDPTALEFVSTAMDINAGTQFGAVRWGLSYDSSTRQYTEITPTIVSAGDPLLKQRDEAFKKWNEVDAAEGNDTYKVPGTENL